MGKGVYGGKERAAKENHENHGRKMLSTHTIQKTRHDKTRQDKTGQRKTWRFYRYIHIQAHHLYTNRIAE